MKIKKTILTPNIPTIPTANVDNNLVENLNPYKILYYQKIKENIYTLYINKFISPSRFSNLNFVFILQMIFFLGLFFEVNQKKK